MNAVSRDNKVVVFLSKLFKDLSKPTCMVGVAFSLFLLVASVLSVNSYNHSNVYHFHSTAMQIFEENEDIDRYKFSGLAIPSGSYTVDVIYSSEEDTHLTYQFGNEANGEIQLAAGQNASVEFKFVKDIPTDTGTVMIYSNRAHPLEIEDIIMTRAEGPIYRDGLIWAFIYLLSIAVIWLVVVDYSKQEHKRAFRFTILLIFVLLFPVAFRQVGVRGTDTCAHMLRVEGVYYGLLDHQFPVVINPEWNNNHGQLAVLYPNIFLYPAALLRLLGVSEYGTWRFVMLILGILSGSFAYRASKVVFKKDWQMMIAIAMIVLNGMHLEDYYRGGKIGGSCIALLFAPLIVAGLYDVFYAEGRKYYYLSVGLAGVICSHITSATVALIMTIAIILINIRRMFCKKCILNILKAFAVFVLLASGSIIGFIRYYFGGWGQDELMWAQYVETSWCFSRFFDRKGTFTFFIIVIATVFIAIYIAKSGIMQLKGFYGVHFLLLGILMWIMTTQYFPWRLLRNISFIRYYTDMLQSGYRFLFAANVLLAFGFTAILGRYVEEYNLTSFVKISIILTFISMAVLLAIEIVDYSDKTRTVLYYDEVIGEVDYDMRDYLPAGTKSEWYQSSEGEISDYEKVNTILYDRNGTHTLYVYTCPDDGQYVVFPQFYYDGYKAWDENGQELDIIKNEHNKIRINLEKTDTPKEIHVKFSVFPYLTVTSIIQFMSWGIVVFIFVITRERKFRLFVKDSVK